MKRNDPWVFVALLCVIIGGLIMFAAAKTKKGAAIEQISSINQQCLVNMAFANAISVKDPVSGKCGRFLFSKEKIPRLIGILPCDCKDLPPNQLITAEIPKQ